MYKHFVGIKAILGISKSQHATINDLYIFYQINIYMPLNMFRTLKIKLQVKNRSKYVLSVTVFWDMEPH